ncbi:MAG: DNA polymerase III subunit alpha [Candidatus Poribacteria bacterium]|nr:DNA polymerase III subunit alpha [Candidatus Poribacteria bacterium]
MHYNFVIPNNLTDAELVRLVQARDESAFAELVSRYSPRIWNIVVENSRQRRDAEEILMDVWLAVWENIIGLRKAESFGGWLRRIAFTACNRYYASNLHRHSEIILSYEDLALQIDREAEQRFQDASLLSEAREAVHNLPQRVRSVAILYYLELWNVKEIAEELDLAIGTVKTKLSEIRRLLRQEFEIEPTRGKTMSQKQEKSESLRTKFKVIGVGEAGCNVIKRMIEEASTDIGFCVIDFGEATTDIEFCVVDTDINTLNTCNGATHVQIGINTVQGQSTEESLELGKRAAAESIDALRSIVSDAKMVIVIAGMSGGTGTCVAPVLASLAREHGALTVCFVTRPFDSEGEHRAEKAEYGLQQLQGGLQPQSDAVIVVPNQRILELVDQELSMPEAYQKSDEILVQGVNAIAEILVKTGEINIDFDDIQETLRDQGTVLMGIGKAEGENRAKIAAENAITSPLLEENNIAGDAVMIVNIASPPNFTMHELDQAMKVIVETCENARPIFGLVYKDELEANDEVLVTVIASGLDSQSDQTRPTTSSEGIGTTTQDSVISPSSGSEFVHLHNHSEYSLLDGACRIPDMVQWAIENSSPAVALTDHGNMFGAWEFYNTAKAAGVNPIVGCEVYVETENAKTEDNSQCSPSHLTLLAEDAVGYHNLLELVSLGYTQGFDRKPRINMEMLREYHDGIIALTGCINGIVPKLICSNQRDEAVRNLLELRDIMGPDNLFVELQNHYIDEELAAYPVMVEFANEYNLPIVGTNDCHYLRKSDHRMHDIRLCIQTRKTVNDPKRIRFNNHFYFKNVDEMQEALKDYPPEAIINTVEIANRCNLKLDYDKNAMPIFEIPEGRTQDSYLKEQCYEGLRQKFGGHLSESIQKRLEYELDIIQQTGYANYFLIVADYVNYANQQDYLLSARGSAASSLVLYALGVISFNPMDYGCLFERFLNLDRMNPPDIDIDFADHARDDVIDYLVRKYGHDSVGKVATFATLRAKTAIKDVGRALEIPIDNIQKLGKLIPFYPGITLDDALEQIPEFQKLAELPENKELIEMSKAVEGMIRHVSCHASAIVVSKGPLSNYAPLFKDIRGQIATQFEGKTVEDVGIIKFDTLGVRSLSETADCLSMIWENHGRKIALEDIPFDDKPTYSLISEGLIAGLFQLETSHGMFKVVTELKAENFEVFSAIPALYRPGPLENGDMQQFIDRKNGVQPIEYSHPLLENALKSTFGVCIYQEQVMQMACDVAGFTLGEADILRDAMGKRKVDVLEKQRPKFINSAVEKGISPKEAEEVYDLLEQFGRYAFNKSHSITYSLLAYRMAYLKTHYPHEFMAAMMTGESADKEKIKRYQTECEKLADFLDVEINLLPIDINASEQDFTVDGNDIRFGFVALKGVSDEVIDLLLAERNQSGSFTSIQDFRNRFNSTEIDEQVIESLIASGAFNALRA